MKVMILSIIVIILSSCTKEMPIPVNPGNRDSVKLLWNKQIYDGTSGFILDPQIWQDKIVFTTEYFKDKSTIQCRDQITGELVWDLDDGTLGKEGDQGYFNPIFLDKMAWQNANDFYTINLNSGSLEKRERFEGWVDPFSSIFEGIRYSVISDKSIDSDENWVMRKGFNEKNWDTICSVKKINGFVPFLSPVNLFVNDKTDTFLILHVGRWNFAASKSDADFYCFDLKNKKFHWILNNMDKDGCSRRPPTVWQGKAYFQGSNTLYCIDIASGKEQWRFSTEKPVYDIVQSPMIVQDGDLYMTSENNGILYCLNATTGNVKWKNTENGDGVRKITYFNNMIIFTSHIYLMAVDARSGQTIWKVRSPNHSDSKQVGFNGWIPCTVNAKDSLIYASDEVNIMAIKAPVPK